MKIIEDKRPWPHNCTRCGAKINNVYEANCGHGFEEWCNDCELSYKCWYRKGKENKPTRQEGEKASELRWACEKWEREKKGIGIFLKHFGPVSNTMGNYTELYLAARKWLDEFDKKMD